MKESVQFIRNRFVNCHVRKFAVALCICFTMALSVFLSNLPFDAGAQTSTGNNTLASSDINAGLTLQATNETINSAVLSPAINSLLNLGPFVFKTSESQQFIMNTKIENQVNNVTQNIEGTDAAYAVVGINIVNALKTLVTSTDQHAVSIHVTITCKSITTAKTTCNNVVQIKPS
jgi:hypothetical protein